MHILHMVFALMLIQAYLVSCKTGDARVNANWLRVCLLGIDVYYVLKEEEQA